MPSPGGQAPGWPGEECRRFRLARCGLLGGHPVASPDGYHTAPGPQAWQRTHQLRGRLRPRHGVIETPSGDGMTTKRLACRGHTARTEACSSRRETRVRADT